jgi:hypothetical protein
VVGDRLSDFDSAETGNYATAAMFAFRSNPTLQISETEKTAGQYLEFVRQLAAGQS